MNTTRNGESTRMKKSLCLASAIMVLPSIVSAQEIAPLPGFYLGAGVGGVAFMNTSTSIGGSITSSLGFGFGALLAGYDFVGPRVELEVAYGQVPVTASLPLGTFNVTGRQLQFMAKGLYDFFPASILTPYVGAGLGVGLVDSTNGAFSSTQFAYEGLVGLGWNLDSQWRVFGEGQIGIAHV